MATIQTACRCGKHTEAPWVRLFTLDGTTILSRRECGSCSDPDERGLMVTASEVEPGREKEYLSTLGEDRRRKIHVLHWRAERDERRFTYLSQVMQAQGSLMASA